MPITPERYATDDTDLREINETVNEINNSIGNNSSEPAFIRNSHFQVSLEIIRPPNRVGYQENDIINNDGAETLPYFDFDAYGYLADRYIEITNVTIVSNNGTTGTKLIPFMHIFNADTVNTNMVDNLPFNPTYDDMTTLRETTIEPNFSTIDHGNNCYLLQAGEKSRVLMVNSLNRLYVAMIASASYVPIRGEKFTIKIKGNIA